MALFLRKSSRLLGFKAFHVQINRQCIHLTCIQFESSTQDTNPSHQDPNHSHQSEKDNETEDVRSRILEASLPFVHQHGWTKTAISAGAESLGYPGTTHGMFLQGGADLVHHFYASCNQQLAEKLKQEAEEVQTGSKLRPPHIFVSEALRFRLELIVPYLAAWPQAMGLMALPNNTPRALANLLTMVDDICYYAGDRSIDISWYTRRLGLAGIYKLSELYLLQDSSPEHQATWRFLNRRIEEAIQLQSVLESSGRSGEVAKEFATAAFTTARNILGLNWNR